MPEISGDDTGRLLERFSEEAYEAGSEACQNLREAAGRNPDMAMALLDTLPGLIDSWALYTLSYLESLEDTGKIGELVDKLPSIVLSLVTSVYGLELGVPVAVLLLIPAGPLTKVIAKCGRSTREPVAEPSPFEARLRATIMSAQASVYRVYFAASSMLEEEPPGGGENLWKPRDMRLMYI